MPLGYGGAVFTSSAGGDIGGGRKFSRAIGGLLVGQKVEVPANTWQTGTAPLYSAPFVYNVSTRAADMNLVGGVFLSTATPTGLVYIPQSTASMGGAPAPVVGGTGGSSTDINLGVAIAWNSATSTLVIFSTVSNTWLGAISTSGAAVFASSGA